MTIQEPKRPRSVSRVKPNQKPVNIALQGGGAHGAFAWGVLDRILEDERLSIEAISATSAGAMNAVVVAHGVSLGGRDGAREKLNEFWTEISRAGELYSPLRTLPWERWLQMYGIQADFSPTYHAFQLMTYLFSPYQLNPFNFNPLKDVLLQVVDFDRLATCERATRVFLSATNVRTGKIKVFENRELCVEAVLASACLPYVFQAVEIDGEAYWDGGFMGNPAIYPLIYRSASKDVIIVHINPIERSKLPRTAPEIFDRMNEISFNSSLMREMRAIAFVSRLIEEGKFRDNDMKKMLIHGIVPGEAIDELGYASKLNADWGHLTGLMEVGRERADAWLGESFERIGVESTVDIRANYL